MCGSANFIRAIVLAMTVNWPVFLIDIESQLWNAGRITHRWASERYAAEYHEHRKGDELWVKLNTC